MTDAPADAAGQPSCADNLADTIAATAAAVTRPEAPDAVRVSRPTRKSEWTLLAALGSLCLLSGVLIGVLAFLRWPERSAGQRIWFLGWMGLLSVGGIQLIVMVIAIASPWLVRVEAQAGAGHLTRHRWREFLKEVAMIVLGVGVSNLSRRHRVWHLTNERVRRALRNRPDKGIWPTI